MEPTPQYSKQPKTGTLPQALRPSARRQQKAFLQKAILTAFFTTITFSILACGQETEPVPTQELFELRQKAFNYPALQQDNNALRSENQSLQDNAELYKTHLEQLTTTRDSLITTITAKQRDIARAQAANRFAPPAGPPKVHLDTTVTATKIRPISPGTTN